MTRAQVSGAKDGALAALDPGRSKCGLVRTDRSRRRVIEALVLPPEECWQRIQHWQAEDPLAALVLGNGTGSAAWRARLLTLVPVILVDEHGSTLAARQRFWQLEPPAP